MEEDFDLELSNTQVEMIVLGSLYARPLEAGFSYINVLNNLDFADAAMAFYHAFFNDYLLTYSNEFTQTKANLFASMDKARLSGYKRFGAYKTIEQLMSFATNSEDELKTQIDELKKWSVLRQLHKNGYDVAPILRHPKFNALTADDCANLVRGNIDKICNKIITGLDDTLDFADNVTGVMDGFLDAPEKGFNCAWDFINKQCSGIMQHDSYCIAMNSNMGKGRSLIYLAMHLALCEGLNIAFFANETSFESMRLAGITTVLNAPQIQQLHGHQLNITEKRFKSGAYLGADGNIIYRHKDSQGNFTETVDQFKDRLMVESNEYKQVKDAIKWFEEQGTHKIWFKNCAANYSDESIQRLVRQAILQRSCDVWFYDTLKHGTGSDMSKWSDLVQTTTRLCEMNQTLPTAAIFSCQLNNSALTMKPEEMTSSQLGYASYIYQLFDVLITIQHMRQNWYQDYSLMIKDPTTGQVTYKSLDENAQLSAANLLKNRRGSKNIYLLQRDLDRNIWQQVNGILVPKEIAEKNLAW